MSVQQPDSSTDRDPDLSTADSSKNDVVVSTDDEKSSGGPSGSDSPSTKIGDVGNDHQESSLNPDEVPGTTPSSYSSSSTEQPAEAEVSSSSTPPSFSNGRNRQQSDPNSANRGKSAHSKSGAFVEVRGSSSSSSDEPGVVDNRKARVLTIFPVIADGDVPVSVTCPSAAGPYGPKDKRLTSRDDNKVISLFAPGGEGKYFHETITTESVFYEEKSPDGATKTDYKKTEERNSMGGETFGSGDIYTPYSAQEEKRLKDYNNRQRYFAGWCTIV